MTSSIITDDHQNILSDNARAVFESLQEDLNSQTFEMFGNYSIVGVNIKLGPDVAEYATLMIYVGHNVRMYSEDELLINIPMAHPQAFELLASTFKEFYKKATATKSVQNENQDSK